MAQIQREDRVNLGAKKFSMWIFIFTSFMFFAALSSGFIVYSGGRGHGLDVIMPRAFLYSTIVIICSSIALFGNWLGMMGWFFAVEYKIKFACIVSSGVWARCHYSKKRVSKRVEVAEEVSQFVCDNTVTLASDAQL